MPQAILRIFVVLVFWLLPLLAVQAQTQRSLATSNATACVAFSPYVGTLTPDYGPAPTAALINQLLDTLVAETPFRCIMTYGVLNGLAAIFPAAQARHLKVIAILWLDKDTQVNSDSIAHGIALARDYPDTIIKLSCGSEVRTRHGYALDSEISRCLDALREAKITQPISTIDTWWEWCNRKHPCQPTRFTSQVDWIGSNIFPWWENKFSGLYPCTSAKQAAAFHITRLEDLRRTYPGKNVVLTEFGWPSGPEKSTEINNHTGEHCGIASKRNQLLVLQDTFKHLAAKGWTGVAFEAFPETWKPAIEGQAGKFWGLCNPTAPFSCPKSLLSLSH